MNIRTDMQDCNEWQNEQSNEQHEILGGSPIEATFTLSS